MVILVEVRLAVLPVVGVLLHDQAVAGDPLDELERTGADGVAAEVGAGRPRPRWATPSCPDGRRGSGAARRPAGSCGSSPRAGPGLDRLDHRQVGLLGRRLQRQTPIEVVLDGLRVERRAVVERDTVLQLEHERLRIGLVHEVASPGIASSVSGSKFTKRSYIGYSDMWSLPELPEVGSSDEESVTWMTVISPPMTGVPAAAVPSVASEPADGSVRRRWRRPGRSVRSVAGDGVGARRRRVGLATPRRGRVARHVVVVVPATCGGGDGRCASASNGAVTVRYRLRVRMTFPRVPQWSRQRRSAGPVACAGVVPPSPQQRHHRRSSDRSNANRRHDDGHRQSAVIVGERPSPSGDERRAASLGRMVSRQPGGAAQRPGLRVRKAERAKRHASEVARRLIQQRGDHKTSLDDIADAAETSVSTLLRYFGSKERLALPPRSTRTRASASMVTDGLDRRRPSSAGARSSPPGPPSASPFSDAGRRPRPDRHGAGHPPLELAPPAQPPGPAGASFARRG